MGLKELNIIFDNPIYHPGETVKGKLFIVLDTPQKYRGTYMYMCMCICIYVKIYECF